MRATFVLACAVATVMALACGESRQPIGEECLRDDDCLSSTCTARACVPAPGLVTGVAGSPPDEEPLLPPGDAAIMDAAEAS